MSLLFFLFCLRFACVFARSAAGEVTKRPRLQYRRIFALFVVHSRADNVLFRVQRPKILNIATQQEQLLLQFELRSCAVLRCSVSRVTWSRHRFLLIEFTLISRCVPANWRIFLRQSSMRTRLTTEWTWRGKVREKEDAAIHIKCKKEIITLNEHFCVVKMHIDEDDTFDSGVMCRRFIWHSIIWNYQTHRHRPSSSSSCACNGT